MELYDLRNGHIRPKDFENIIDPLLAKRRVKESYHLEKTVGGMIGSLNGYMLKKMMAYAVITHMISMTGQTGVS